MYEHKKNSTYHDTAKAWFNLTCMKVHTAAYPVTSGNNELKAGV